MHVLNSLALGMPGPYELLVILLVVLLLFGASRLPEIGRSLGKGIREFKKATREIAGDDDEGNEKKKSESQNPPDKQS